MRQELKLTVDSECEQCEGHGLDGLAENLFGEMTRALCGCVQAIPAKSKPYFTDEQLEQMQRALDGSEVEE